MPDVKATTLDQALVLSYTNNPELLSKWEEMKATDEEIPQAYSGWLPTATVNHTTGQETVKIGNAAPGNDNVSITDISISQPLFDGFKTIKKTDQAYNVVSSSRASFRDKEQEILLETVTAYITLVESKDIMDLSGRVEEILSEHLEATKAKFAVGNNSKTDVAQSKARLSTAKSNRIKAEGEYAAAKANYKRVIGIEPNKPLIPKKLPPLPHTISSAIELAKSKNPLILQAKYNEKAASNNIDVNKAAILPNVNLVGKLSTSDRASTFGSGKTESGSVLLNFSIPLFQSGSEYSKVRQAKIEVQQKKHDKLSTTDKVIESTHQKWNELITSRSTIKSNWETVKAERVALEGVKSEADNGVRSVLDVLDAEQSLFEAEVNLIKAKSSEVIASYNLKSAIGELNVVELGLPIEPYNPDENLDKVRFKMIGF